MQESNKAANAKTVNGIELAVGQQWTTTDFGVIEIADAGPLYSEYPWRFRHDDALYSFTADGKYWPDDEEPMLLECIYNPVQPKQPSQSLGKKQFSPKPGDKIICSNGEELTCCTLEFLQKDVLALSMKNDNIFAYRIAKESKIHHKYDWMYWKMDGSAYWQEWSIKEIIPAQQEVKQDVAEVTPAQGDNTVGAVFQEKTYTLKQIEDVVFAIRDEFHMIHPLGTKFMITKVQEHLQKKNHPEYKLYLELKVKFEGKE